MVTALTDSKIKQILFMQSMPNFVGFLLSQFDVNSDRFKNFRDFLFGGVLLRCNLLVRVIENGREPTAKFSRSTCDSFIFASIFLKGKALRTRLYQSVSVRESKKQEEDLNLIKLKLFKAGVNMNLSKI